MRDRKEPSFHIHEWLVEPDLNRISRDGEGTRLDPQVMSLLVLLAETPGAVVRKERILEVVWGGAHVADATLAQAVSRLRKALGDDWKHPRFLETISKSGYRLIAPVVGRESPGPEAADSAPATTGERHSRRWLHATSFLFGAATIALLAFIGRVVDEPSVSPADMKLDPVPAVTLPGRQGSPAISPDGTRIAFTWLKPGSENWDIHVQLVGAPEPVRMTESPARETYPAWTRDGQHLVFARIQEDRCGIHRMTVLGGAEVKLADCRPRIQGLAISPDGERLAVSEVADGESATRIHLINPREGSRRPVDPGTGSQGDRSPAFSPDGEWLAFTRVLATERHAVMIVPVRGGPAVRLTHDAWGRTRGVGFSRGGDHLLFSSDRDGRYALWQLPVAGGGMRRLPINDEWVTQPSLAVDSDRFLYRTFRDLTNIYRLGIDAAGDPVGEPEAVVSSTRSELLPQIAPSGWRISFASTRSGTMEIYSSGLDGSAIVRHTDLKGPRPSAARWSPDGRQLVFDAAVGGDRDLWIVGVDETHPRRLTSTRSDEVNPVFSKDGRRIYFASNREGAWKIYKMSRSGGPARLVTGGFLAQEDPGGRRLYVYRPAGEGIWRMPVEGGAEEPVVRDVQMADWASWVVRKRSLWIVDHNPTGIVRIDLETGKSRRFWNPSKQMPYMRAALDVSTEEDQLFFVRIDRSDDEVMLVEPAGPRDPGSP